MEGKIWHDQLQLQARVQSFNTFVMSIYFKALGREGGSEDLRSIHVMAALGKGERESSTSWHGREDLRASMSWQLALGNGRRKYLRKFMSWQSGNGTSMDRKIWCHGN